MINTYIDVSVISVSFIDMKTKLKKDLRTMYWSLFDLHPRKKQLLRYHCYNPSDYYTLWTLY